MTSNSKESKRSYLMVYNGYYRKWHISINDVDDASKVKVNAQSCSIHIYTFYPCSLITKTEAVSKMTVSANHCTLKGFS